MSLIENLHTSTNRASRTENGALTNTSSLDPVLDFFSKAGAMRGREVEAFKLFQKAFDADPQSATRCLFYLRDIRGGQGERSVFRYILEQLDASFVDKILKYVPEYGRWDEVPLTPAGIELIRTQLNADIDSMADGDSVSLLAKWLPSENTSSPKTREKAKKLIKALELKPSQYRKRIVALRKYYDNFLERLMSENRWAEIDYSKLPSQAHKKHVKAFYRHDEARYKAYLESVQKGEAKINSGTLFAYQLYDMVQERGQDKAADALWKNLPDYTRGENALVLADVSGSMTGFPMSVSVSLALYFAERNKGIFQNYFMTFTTKSRLQKVVGSTLSAKMRSIEDADWDGSTNIQSAFDAILDAAKKGNASPDEMPRILYIISDMEFDAANGGAYWNKPEETNFEAIQRKYAEAGYEMPHIVFWNADARSGQSPVTKYDKNVTLISGSNQSAFQYAVEGKTPLESMMDILNSERYAKIEVPKYVL